MRRNATAIELGVKTLNTHDIDVIMGLLGNDRLTDAEQHVRALLQQYPNAGILWKILGVTLERQGKDSLDALRKATELMPDDAESHGNLGAALHDRGSWRAALVSLERTLALQPNNADALVQLGNVMRELGRARDAVPLYRRALQQNPRLLEAQNNLGNAFLQLQLPDEAAECYHRALAIGAEDPQVLCNLGNALRQAGRLDAALDATRRALARDPTLSIAHNNLGLVLASSGECVQALSSYRQALILDPAYVDAAVNFGNALRELGRRRDAAAWYARAVELDPRRPENLCSLGGMQFDLGKIDEAAMSFRRALALRPHHAPALAGLAAALRMQHRYAEAQASCESALAADPEYVEAMCLLGELRADQGRFSAAEQLFQRALEVRPNFAFAYVGIAKHRRMTSDDWPWLQKVEALTATRLPLEEAIALRYALGKYFDDVGRYEAAFGHYRQANELTARRGQVFDKVKLTNRVDAIIRSIDARFLAASRAGANDCEIPVFIVGMPRSGTSLVEQILASHPAVFGAGELPSWEAEFDALNFESERRSALDLLPGIAQAYLARLCEFSGKALWATDKMPVNFLYAGLIHAALPRARIIHVRRHPVDTCLSIYFQNFSNMSAYTSDLESLAHYYGEYVRITDHWRALLPPSIFLEIPYEGLIGDQELWTRRLLDFVGLSWDPKCLDFHRTERVVITASRWQVRQKLNSASAGRWKHYQAFLGPLERLAPVVS